MIDTTNNKRIAKNTLLLYIRMLVLMAVELYTSRVVLRALGVVDYGVYNAVAGFALTMGFVLNSLSGATSRFITVELGKGESGNVSKVFRCSLTIHYILAVCILLLAETVCLWFVANKLVIPQDRHIAALWVYQFSIISFIVNIISSPYNALIIAYERMGAFAYISIFEGLGRFGVALLISFCFYDKLIIYTGLLLLVKSTTRMFYMQYCRKHLGQTNFKWLWNQGISREIMVYTGWTLNGNLAVMGYTQGINVLLNLYFGPVVNAARGIAVQVQTAIGQFCGSFFTAVRPQVIKSYVSGELDYMHKLVLTSSRYGFALILLISLPILVNTQYILNLWLGEVPEHTVSFTRLVVLASMNYTLSNPVLMAIHATGDLKKFQLIEGTILLTVVPISWICLKYVGVSPEMVFIIYLLIEVITQFVRVWIVYPRIRLAKRKYISDIMWPIFKICIPLSLITLLLASSPASNFVVFVLQSLVCILCTIVVVFMLMMNRSEKKFFVNKVFKKTYESEK